MIDILEDKDPEVHELYMKLQLRHMEDVRLGRILKEKRSRDEQLSLPLRSFEKGPEAESYDGEADGPE